MAKRSVHEFSRSDLAKARLHAYTPGASGGAGASTQPADDAWTPNDTIRPPVDLELLAALTLMAPLRRSCIAAITLNTVARGFRLEVREGFEDDDPGDVDPREVEQRIDSLARRDLRMHRPSFARLMAASVWDRQECGNGYIEASRNRLTGEIDGLYHPIGKRVRRNGDRTGWVIGPKGGRGIELTHYLDFGTKVIYDDDGRPTNRLADGASRWDRNELIPLQMFTSASRDYGLPPDAQLANDYLGDKLAAAANVGYFDNSGVPPTVIFVTGSEAEDGGASVEVEVDPEFVAAVANTLKGGANARVAVVPLPAGVEANKIDLAVLSERDVGFVGYRTDNRRRSLGAWRLSPIFVADIEDTNYSTAAIERKLTKEQVFDPEQAELADILDQTIVRELAPHLTLRFVELDVVADEDRRKSADSLADRGKITNGEYRDAHGFPPLPEAEQGVEPDVEAGEVPFGWHAELVKAKAVALNPLDPRRRNPELGDVPADEREAEIAKAIREGREAELAGDVEDEFDRAVVDAVRAVSAMADDAELHPVVIEKTAEGKVSVTPYARNGVGAG